MVEELEVQETKKRFVTENKKFEIVIKNLTLEKFQHKLTKKDLVENKPLRSTIIERWCIYRTRPVDNKWAYSREEFLEAVTELKNYLFSGFDE